MWHSSKRYPKEQNRDLSVKERIVEAIDNFIERRRYSRLVQHTRKTIYQYYERRNKQESKIKEK